MADVIQALKGVSPFTYIAAILVIFIFIKIFAPSKSNKESEPTKTDDTAKTTTTTTTEKK